MEFFERLKLEIEDIQDELFSIPRKMPIRKICDFGCGEGYTTLGLMLALKATESIGVDKFSDNFLSPSLQNVEKVFRILRDTTLKTINFEEGSLQQELQRLFSESSSPVFQKGDVLKGDNFPDNVDFAYCKRVFGNIYTGEYDNLPNGEEGVSLAINNIARTIRQGGIFCAVEKTSSYFAPIFEQIGLKFLRICRVQRGEIGDQGRLTSTTMIGQYFVYCYQKS